MEFKKYFIGRDCSRVETTIAISPYTQVLLHCRQLLVITGLALQAKFPASGRKHM